MHQFKKITAGSILLYAVFYAAAFTLVRVVFCLVRGEPFQGMLWIAPLVAIGVFAVVAIGGFLLKILVGLRNHD